MSARRLVTLSLGMGVDSAALLTRWLLEPASRQVTDQTGRVRPFQLADLTVVTAMTGDEYAATEQAMNIGNPSYRNALKACAVLMGGDHFGTWRRFPVRVTSISKARLSAHSLSASTHYRAPN